MNIVLIGYRGSGKSSVGRLLAARLGWAFVDTDEQIVRRAGKNIRDIFTQSGEPGFRKLESAVVKKVSRADRTVIAAGGGVVLNPENVALLKHRGKLVWLKASPEILWTHIQADQQTTASRPNLTAAGGLEEIRHLLAARTLLYESAADVTLEVSTMEIHEVVDHVATWVRGSAEHGKG